MTRVKRALYRATEILDYRTFVVATGFLALVLVGYLVVASIQQAHDATLSANHRGAAATRRIDLLNTEIQQLQGAIALGRDERGQLAAAVAVLSRQVQELGGRPVVTVSPGTTVIVTAVPSPMPVAHPTATRTAAPSPKPVTHQTTSPTASPSPSCLIRGLCKKQVR